MRVFSVPVSAPFLRTVIAALVEGGPVNGFDVRAHPERLAQATLYLPTRRAGRMAREIFLDELKTDAAVLPRIVALGDIDEDELAFSEESESYGGAAPLEIPPKLGELDRRLTLARLVAAWAKTPVSAPLVIGGPASTLALASDLARLMDDMVTRGVGWEALDGLVPDQLDKYWQHSLEFLRIARQAWPAHLAEIAKIEPAPHGRDVLVSEAMRPSNASAQWHRRLAQPDIADKISLGMTNLAVIEAANPEMEALAIAVAMREARHLDKSAALAMHALLQRLGIKRSDVELLGEPAPHGRDVLASEAMRPSNASAQWHRRLAQPDIADKISHGMTNLAVIEAANPEMEALAIAVAMREARHLDKSAALVTPDRALARRVMSALGRWNLAFDDSGGDPLMDTSVGIFPRLAAETVAKQLEPPTLLALIKHPLCRLDGPQSTFKDAVEALELALLRGTRPAAGSGGLARDFDRFRAELAKLRGGETSSLHASEPRTRLKDKQLDRAQSLIAALQRALAPLESLSSSKPYDFAELAKRHRSMASRWSSRAIRDWRSHPRSTSCSASERNAR